MRCRELIIKQHFYVIFLCKYCICNFLFNAIHLRGWWFFIFLTQGPSFTEHGSAYDSSGWPSWLYSMVRIFKIFSPLSPLSFFPGFIVYLSSPTYFSNQTKSYPVQTFWSFPHRNLSFIFPPVKFAFIISRRKIRYLPLFIRVIFEIFYIFVFPAIFRILSFCPVFWCTSRHACGLPTEEACATLKAVTRQLITTRG